MIDPAKLTADLVRCASVTPTEGGAIRLLDDLLTAHGFTCSRCDRGEVANLYARFGQDGPVFGFNGHTDVVPPGDDAAWTHPPFSAAETDGAIWGRGSVDMKSGVAAFVTAAVAVAAEAPKGSIAILITGDEEGPAVDGTRAILDWMGERQERLDVCLVGEPTCPEALGDMIKIGRRGSATGKITAVGRQGHSAYPHRALNPLPALVRLMDRLATHELDQGSDSFDPSTLAITTIDVGNPATNVIPAEGRATVNIRFNDLHTGASLETWIRQEMKAIEADTGVALTLDWRVSGEAFLTAPGPFSTLVSNAVTAETGLTPALSTSGGTSDARFIRAHCPVVEFGLVGKGMHQVDERVSVADVRALSTIYQRILRDWFAQ